MPDSLAAWRLTDCSNILSLSLSLSLSVYRKLQRHAFGAFPPPTRPRSSFDCRDYSSSRHAETHVGPSFNSRSYHAMRAHLLRYYTIRASLARSLVPFHAVPIPFVPSGNRPARGRAFRIVFFSFREVKGRPKVASNTFDIS